MTPNAKEYHQLAAYIKHCITPETVTEYRPIDFAGITNAREMSGYINSAGLKIKPRTLIRSGHLHDASAKDTELLAGTYKLGTVIDLRTERETEERLDQTIPGAKYINLPMPDMTAGFGEAEPDDDDPGRYLQDLISAGCIAETGKYSQLVFGDTARSAFRKFFGLLLEAGGERAVLFHSAAGKDRTGVAAAILLSLLGFEDEYIIADYMYTNTANASAIKRDVSAVSGFIYDTAELDRVRRINGVQSHMLEFALSKIRIEYGSVADFAKEEYKLSYKDTEELKRLYLS